MKGTLLRYIKCVDSSDAALEEYKAEVLCHTGLELLFLFLSCSHVELIGDKQVFLICSYL